MAWTSITYSCGHTGELQLFGSSRSREYAIANAERGLCPDCYEAKLAADRAAATAAAAAEAAEQDLPALEGTDKQVAWAVRIRQKFLAALDQWLADNPVRDGVDPTPLIRAVQSIQGETSAHWWIENGQTDASFRIRRRIVERMTEIANKPETPAPSHEAAPVEVPVLRPETVATEAVTTIAIADEQIALLLPERNDAFRTLVKEKGYEWQDGKWRRKISTTTGSAEDRAAEIANALLSAGFPVRVANEAVREKAVSGEFEPEHTRWIYRSTKDEFLISWNRSDKENEKIYMAARGIRGAKWSRPYVVVPPTSFEGVLDLADLNGFRLTAGARELVEEATAAREAALIVKPGAPKTVETPKRPAPTGEIDASLRDDD